MDSELRVKLQELKILQAEKANAHFLEIAKKTASIENLNDIQGEVGKILLSAEDLGNYITNFYSSLFRFDENV